MHDSGDGVPVLRAVVSGGALPNGFVPRATLQCSDYALSYSAWAHALLTLRRPAAVGAHGLFHGEPGNAAAMELALYVNGSLCEAVDTSAPADNAEACDDYCAKCNAFGWPCAAECIGFGAFGTDPCPPKHA